MAKLSQADLLAQFKELTLVELSEFVKAFEEEFDVTAAAPVAVAAAGGAAVQLDGQMIDRPVLLKAERLLARA